MSSLLRSWHVHLGAVDRGNLALSVIHVRPTREPARATTNAVLWTTVRRTARRVAAVLPTARAGRAATRTVLCNRNAPAASVSLPSATSRHASTFMTVFAQQKQLNELPRNDKTTNCTSSARTRFKRQIQIRVRVLLSGGCASATDRSHQSALYRPAMWLENPRSGAEPGRAQSIDARTCDA